MLPRLRLEIRIAMLAAALVSAAVGGTAAADDTRLAEVTPVPPPRDASPVPPRAVTALGPSDHEWCGTVPWEVRPPASHVRGTVRAKSHGDGPRVTLVDNVAIVADDGTLLEHDSVLDLEGTTLHFTPTAAGWSVASEPLAGLEPDPGAPLFSGAEEWTSAAVDLTTFRFPFGGRLLDRVHVTNTFVVAFEPPTETARPQLGGQDFLEDLTPRLAVLQQGARGWGFDAFAREEADRLVVTWRSSAPPGELDVQAVLWEDGSIDVHLATLEWVEHGAVGVLDPDAAWWRDAPVVGSEADPIGDRPAPAADLGAVSVRRPEGSNLLVVSAELAGPPAGDDVTYSVSIWGDVSGAADRRVAVDWIDGAWVPGFSLPRVTGTTLTFSLDAGEVDPGMDASVVVYVEAEASATGDVDAMFIDAAFTPASDVEQGVLDLSSELPWEGAAPPHEAFTLPFLDLSELHDAYVAHFGADSLDGVGIYQNFTEWVVTYAGAYARSGNPGAEGISSLPVGPPGTPVLMNLNRLGYRRNASTEDRLVILQHEFGHHWLFRSRIVEDGEPRWSMNPTYGHPAAWVHLPAPGEVFGPGESSTMGGARWTDNGDGTFTASDPIVEAGFSWLELYLMGLAAPDEVPDWWYLRDADPALPAAYFPDPGITVDATRVPVTVDQVIAAEGPRVPAYGESPTAFRSPLVLVVREGTEPSPAEIAEVRETCELWMDVFAASTLGRGSVDCLTPSRPPEAVIIDPPGDVAIRAGEVVAFTGEGRDPDGESVALEWSFPAGPASGPGPHEVAFPDEGTFEIVLRATDTHGLADPTPASVTVEVGCASPAPLEGLRLRLDGGRLVATWDAPAAEPATIELGQTANPAADPEVIESVAGAESELRADAPAGTAFLKLRASDGPGCLGPW